MIVKFFVMRFGTIFGTTTVSTEWRTTEGTTSTYVWTGTTETAPMSSALVSTTTVVSTTETDGTTEALTTTTTTTTRTMSSSTKPELMLDNGQNMESQLEEKGSSSVLFREVIDDELRDSYPAAGNNSISRQKSVQAAQQNATFDGSSRNISRNSHKFRVNMKGTDQRVKDSVNSENF